MKDVIEQAIDSLLESTQVSINIDDLDWIQTIYDERGEDAAMEAFEDNANAIASKKGWKIGPMEFDGERAGLLAVFTIDGATPAQAKKAFSKVAKTPKSSAGKGIEAKIKRFVKSYMSSDYPYETATDGKGNHAVRINAGTKRKSEFYDLVFPNGENMSANMAQYAETHFSEWPPPAKEFLQVYDRKGNPQK